MVEEEEEEATLLLDFFLGSLVEIRPMRVYRDTKATRNAPWERYTSTDSVVASRPCTSALSQRSLYKRHDLYLIASLWVVAKKNRKKKEKK